MSGLHRPPPPPYNSFAEGCSWIGNAFALARSQGKMFRQVLLVALALVGLGMALKLVPSDSMGYVNWIITKLVIAYYVVRIYESREAYTGKEKVLSSRLLTNLGPVAIMGLVYALIQIPASEVPEQISQQLVSTTGVTSVAQLSAMLLGYAIFVTFMIGVVTTTLDLVLWQIAVQNLTMPAAVSRAITTMRTRFKSIACIVLFHTFTTIVIAVAGLAITLYMTSTVEESLRGSADATERLRTVVPIFTAFSIVYSMLVTSFKTFLDCQVGIEIFDAGEIDPMPEALTEA